MKTFIKRMAVLAAVLLLAALTACSSCRMDTQPSVASADTQPQSAQQLPSGTKPGAESDAETVAAETVAEDSQEQTYNDYGEWDIP